MNGFTTTSVASSISHRRRIHGISAVLLPFLDGAIDFRGYERLLVDTAQAGLVPAVNMDTGYVNLLTPDERDEVLAFASRVLAGSSFVCGAFVEGSRGELAGLYLREVDVIQSAGGTPILFQCSALTSMNEHRIARVYEVVARDCERMLAFELGAMFAPFGQIYSIELVERLMAIPSLVGMKHSSLDRRLEWQRLALRGRLRPDFKIYTGNDLAIDMVMYGSDYLLGLSAFHPRAFSARDKFWESGDPRFYELNDLLQYLGMFAFRAPVPAYKHSAAQFLKSRGLIKSDQPPPGALRRSVADLAILQDILARIDAMLEARA